MLNHPTQDKLASLNLHGMVTAMNEQRSIAEYDSLSFEERLGLLVDRELTDRSERKLASRLKTAHLRQSAVAEDIDFKHSRSLDKALVLTLLNGEWIRRHNNCIVTGPTGVGKSYLACALANQACRSGWKVLYTRATRLFGELALARADGSFGRRLASLARIDLLVLDDWGLAPLNPEAGRDLLELLDDRYDRKSTLVASQIPVEEWHPLIRDPTLADAALDRLVHNAHRIALNGESMRKTRANLTTQTPNNT